MEALFEKFEGCHRVVYLETDFADQVDDEEGLDIWLLARVSSSQEDRINTFKTDYAPHDLVDLLDVHVRIIFADRIFLFDKCQPGSDDQEYQSPEPQISTKRNQSVFERNRTKVLVATRQRDLRIADHGSNLRELDTVE
jgi:hypothetical protein